MRNESIWEMNIWEIVYNNLGFYSFLLLISAIFLFRWEMSRIAEKISQRESHLLNQEMKKLSNQLERGSFVFRAQFEKEFNCYVKLTQCISLIVINLNNKIQEEVSLLCDRALYCHENEFEDSEDYYNLLPSKFIDKNNEITVKTNEIECLFYGIYPFLGNESIKMKYLDMINFIKNIIYNPPGHVNDERTWSHLLDFDKENYESVVREQKNPYRNRIDELNDANEKIHQMQIDLGNLINQRFHEVYVIGN